MLINYIRTPHKYVAEVKYDEVGNPYPVINEVGGNPYGVIIATAKNQVGWAMCSPRDYYNKEMGMRIALNRADFYGTDKEALLKEAPYSIREALLKMYDRSERYYK